MRRSALLAVQLFAYVFASARITCSSSSSPLSRFASDNKPGREPNPIQWRAAFFAISSEGCALSTKEDKMSRVLSGFSHVVALALPRKGLLLGCIFTDTMVDSGTSVEGSRGGWASRRTASTCIRASTSSKRRILEAVRKPSDLVLSHPPYHCILTICRAARARMNFELPSSHDCCECRKRNYRRC